MNALIVPLVAGSGFGLIMLILLGVLIYSLVRNRSQQKQVQHNQRTQLASALTASRAAAEEDVTRFGEELQRLDSDVMGHPLDEAMQQDYSRALDAYENAKTSLAAVQRPEEISNVSQILEDGRYAVACVKARVNNQPLPQKRPPCFFNPAHGPSVRNVQWSPDGGSLREVPACAADAERVEAGAEPYIRTVPVGSARVPYWQAGAAYAPWAQGYFSPWRGSSMIGDMFVMSMIFNGMSGLPWMLGGMGEGLGMMGAGIGEGLGDIGAGIGTGIEDIGQGIGDVFGGIGNGIEDIGSDIGGFFNDLF